MTIGAGFVTSCRALRRESDDKTVTSENLRHFSSIPGSHEAGKDAQRCITHLIRLSRSGVNEGKKKGTLPQFRMSCCVDNVGRTSSP
jgi:hypothetical protein